MSTGTVYSDISILKEKEEGHIIIEPFNEKRLGNCSYALTSSEIFFRCGTTEEVLNPWSQDSSKMWVRGEVKIAEEDNSLDLEEGDKYILLKARESILLMTEEFVGGREHIACTVHGCAFNAFGLLSVTSLWLHVGRVNRVPLLVTNCSDREIALPVGVEIAEVVFLEAGEPFREEDSVPLDVLIKNWTPELQFPSYGGEEKAPLQIEELSVSKN